MLVVMGQPCTTRTLTCVAAAALVCAGAACVPDDEPCDASAALANAPSSLALSEGGRGTLALTPVDGVDVALDTLAPGFTVRPSSDGTNVVVGAPYGVSGTLPSRLIATCSDGTDAAGADILLEVAPLSVAILTETPPPAPLAPALGVAAVEGGVVVAGAGGTWVFGRDTSTWRSVDATFAEGPVKAAPFDAHDVLLLDAVGNLALLDVATDAITPLATSGTAPGASWGAALLHESARGFAVCGAAVDGTGAPIGGSRHCRVTSLIDEEWELLEPTGFAPVGRTDAVVGVDVAGARLVLFGGEREEGPATDAWSFDIQAQAWSRLGKQDAAPPAARPGACGAVDPLGRRLFVVGGGDGRGLMVMDLERDDTAWHELEIGGLPQPARCAAAFDAQAGRIVVVTEDGVFALLVSPPAAP